jgi:hypothetical protein
MLRNKWHGMAEIARGKIHLIQTKEERCLGMLPTLYEEAYELRQYILRTTSDAGDIP